MIHLVDEQSMQLAAANHLPFVRSVCGEAPKIVEASMTGLGVDCPECLRAIQAIQSRAASAQPGQPRHQPRPEPGLDLLGDDDQEDDSGDGDGFDMEAFGENLLAIIDDGLTEDDAVCQAWTRPLGPKPVDRTSSPNGLDLRSAMTEADREVLRRLVETLAPLGGETVAYRVISVVHRTATAAFAMGRSGAAAAPAVTGPTVTEDDDLVPG